MSAGSVHSVLFACTLNSVRSPMAEALARRLYGSRLYVDSAGLKKTDRDPFVLTVLDEIGIAFADDQPQMLDEIACDSFDLIVCLSREAFGRAETLTRATSVEVLYWPVADPTEEGATREQRLHAYRGVRDGLAARIKREIGPRVPDRVERA